MPTLVQISDLHRSHVEPIDNDTLLASVISDIDRFAAANEAPEALIISGDLVQGAKLGSPSFAEDMKAQYDVAFEFIDRLCVEIVSGDRSKVVVVPGNHDVCWNTSKASMEQVPTRDYPKDLKRELSSRDSPYRWSWTERKLYRVADEGLYASRIGAYWDAFETFYNGVGLPLPVDRRRGHHLFNLFGDRALVAAFETTHRNDHLRYEAQLSTGSASKVALHIRAQRLKPELLLAVWHHSVHGAPSQEDYLNIEAIKEMAGLGFQVGFHGHQHHAENTDLSVGTGGGGTMCLISGGSLCAGWQDLPRGVNRQYNIVAFDEDLGAGTLFVREMVEGNQFAARTSGRFLGGSVPLKWSSRALAAAPSKPAHEARLREITVAVEEANKKHVSTEETGALLELQPASGTYPRLVLMRALQIDRNWPKILGEFAPPTTSEEAVTVAEAAYQTQDFDTLSLVLSGGLLPADVRGDFIARRDFLQLRKGKK